MENKIYNLVELSEKLKVTYRTMQNYVYSGAIKADKVGGRWYVTDESLTKFLSGKNGDDMQFLITASAWEHFKKYGCMRAEVGTESADYMRGYLKGVQTAIIDLLDGTGIPFDDFRDDLSEIYNRLEKIDKAIKEAEQTEKGGA